MSTKRPLTAQELRKIAEAADGQRGKTLDLMERTTPAAFAGAEPASKQNTRYDIIDTQKSRPANDRFPNWSSVLEVRTDFQNPERAKVSVHATFLQIENGARIELDCPNYDALFWSEASVEKFFFPYYVRVLPFEDFLILYNAFYKGTDEDTIYGFIHYPPTDFERMDLNPDTGINQKLFVISAKGLVPAGTFIEKVRNR